MQSSLEEALIRAKDAFQQARTLVFERVKKTMGTAENEVLAVGKNITEIVRVAQEQVESLEDVGRALDPRSGSRNVARVVDEQTTVMTSFIRELAQRLQEQDQAAAQAASLTVDILRFGREIEAIAREARVLTVNARIEAARLGEHGRAFAVIAGQMNDVSSAVTKANATMSDFALTLSQLLPEIAANSAAARDASVDLIRRNDEAKVAFGDLQDLVQSAVAKSRTHGARVLSLAQDGVSHLQFQDPVQQELMQLEPALARISSAAGLEDVPAKIQIWVSETLDEPQLKAVADDGGSLSSGEINFL